MAGQLPGIPSQQAIARYATPMNMAEEPQLCTRKLYFSRQEIEDGSPSRKDGVDLQKESLLRKLYCSFLQELGMKLKVPQVTIASAMMLCHQFYMRQSHAKNDWQTIATVSMFLGCKIEDTPRLLKDVVVVAYEILFKWDPSAPRRIRQREIYDKQKELILVGERLLLSTIAFDVDVQLPYKPLVAALKKLTISPVLAKVAWNFVNDWLRTTLCLLYKPHYIAAGSLFLAAKFQKVKLPTEKGKVWWMEFDISPKQLEEVIQQMIRLLEKDKKPALPPKQSQATQSTTDLVGKEVDRSPQSCISNESNANGLSGLGATAENEEFTKSWDRGGDKYIREMEVFQCQTSDSGASSVVEDGDSGNQPRTQEPDQNSSHKINTVRNTYGQINVNQIRDTLKRRRCEKSADQSFLEAKNVEVGSEAWIERELENGIELASDSSERKRRRALFGPCVANSC